MLHGIQTESRLMKLKWNCFSDNFQFNEQEMVIA